MSSRRFLLFLLPFLFLVALPPTVFGQVGDGLWVFVVYEDGRHVAYDHLTLEAGEIGNVVAPPPSAEFGDPVCKWLGIEGNHSFSFMTPVPGESVFSCGYVSSEGEFSFRKSLYLTVVPRADGQEVEGDSAIIVGGGNTTLDDVQSANYDDVGRVVAIYPVEQGGGTITYQVKALVSDGGSWVAGEVICTSDTRPVGSGPDCSGYSSGHFVEIEVAKGGSSVTFTVYYSGEQKSYTFSLSG